MKNYNKDAVCPKCECEKIGSVFHEKGTWTDYFEKNRLAILEFDTDTIRRHCLNCGYEWNEAPLDA